jgi:hypothetical protein
MMKGGCEECACARPKTSQDMPWHMVHLSNLDRVEEVLEHAHD